MFVLNIFMHVTNIRRCIGLSHQVGIQLLLRPMQRLNPKPQDITVLLNYLLIDLA